MGKDFPLEAQQGIKKGFFGTSCEWCYVDTQTQPKIWKQSLSLASKLAYALLLPIFYKHLGFWEASIN